MLFTDLLRMTVLLLGAEATALGAVTALSAGREGDTLTIALAAGWWVLAALIGLWTGRQLRETSRIYALLRSAKIARILPDVTPNQVLVNRLWPLGVFALAAGGLAWVWPQVAAVAAGYAVMWSLGWRKQELAVTAIEERDGVRFYVEPTSALQPIKLVRVPGLARERGEVQA
jgi:hypothetical protein